jgi:hypothetical protein
VDWLVEDNISEKCAISIFRAEMMRWDTEGTHTHTHTNVYGGRRQPLIELNLTKCLSGRFFVLMAGDINVKHIDWNSRLITARGSFLHD